MSSATDNELGTAKTLNDLRPIKLGEEFLHLVQTFPSLPKKKLYTQLIVLNKKQVLEKWHSGVTQSSPAAQVLWARTELDFAKL